MGNIIASARKLTIGTTATTVPVNCYDVLIVNASEEATVYFKEKAKDGVNATADNGFALLPKTMMPFSVNADKLSLIASAADTDVRLLYLK